MLRIKEESAKAATQESSRVGIRLISLLLALLLVITMIPLSALVNTNLAFGAPEFQGTVDPTCTLDGYDWWLDPDTGESWYGEYVPALGHTWVSVNWDGHGWWGICGVCGWEGYISYIPETGTVDPTCTLEGYDWKYDPISGQYWYSNYIPAFGHTWESITWDGYGWWAICEVCGWAGYISYAPPGTDTLVTVNFPGFDGVKVRSTGSAGWLTMGEDYVNQAVFTVPDGEELTGVQVTKGGMTFDFIEGVHFTFVAGEPITLDVPFTKIVVFGLAAACDIGIAQADWVYRSAPATVGVPNYYLVFDNVDQSVPYRVSLDRTGFYTIVATAGPADTGLFGADVKYQVYFNNFYRIEVPPGVTDVQIASNSWIDTSLENGNLITLIQDFNDPQDAYLSFVYNGKTYEKNFKLDGSNPFLLFFDQVIVNFPGFDEVLVRTYGASGWQTVGTDYTDQASFWVIEDEAITTVQVTKGGMTYNFTGADIAFVKGQPLILDVPITKIAVFGLSSECSIGIAQADWIYRPTPANVGVVNYYLVFDNVDQAGPYKVSLDRNGYYTVQLDVVLATEPTVINEGAKYQAYCSHFYRIEVPAGVSDIQLASNSWADASLAGPEGNLLTLLQDKKNQKQGYVSFVYNGKTYEKTFPLDGITNPFTLYFKSVIYEPATTDQVDFMPFDGDLYELDDKVTVLGPDPQRAGYLFTGWLCDWDNAVYQQGDTFDMPSVNVTLTAQWKADSLYYTVSFDAQGGTPEPAEQVIEHGGYAVKPPDPTRTGYTFLGWYYLDPQGLDADWLYNFGVQTVAWDITLTAKWQLSTYRIFYIPNGGISFMLPTTATYGSTVTLRTNTYVNLGYSFVEWNTAPDGSGVSYSNGESFPYTTEGDLRLYAIWGPLGITFNANDGSGDTAAQAVSFGQLIQLNTNPFNRPGWTFTGWSLFQNGVGISIPDQQTFRYLFPGNLVLFAQWSPATPITDPDDDDDDNNGNGGGNNGGNTGGDTGATGGITTLAATPATVAAVVEPAVTAPIINITPVQTPTESPLTDPAQKIVDDPIPLNQGDLGGWSLVNLLLAALGILLALILLALLAAGRKRTSAEGAKTRGGKNWVFWAISLIVSIAAVVLFILTENMSAPMILIDMWTIWQVIIFAVLLVFFLLGMMTTKTIEQQALQDV